MSGSSQVHHGSQGSKNTLESSLWGLNVPRDKRNHPVAFIEPIIPGYFIVEHSDNETFPVNSNCICKLIYEYIRVKVGIPDDMEFDLCDDGGNPVDLYDKEEGSYAYNHFHHKRKYYIFMLERGNNGMLFNPRLFLNVNDPNYQRLMKQLMKLFHRRKPEKKKKKKHLPYSHKRASLASPPKRKVPRGSVNHSLHEKLAEEIVVEKPVPLYFFVEHSDNQIFTVNANCNCKLIYEYIRLKAGIPDQFEFDLSDVNGRLLNFYESEEGGLGKKYFNHKETYYILLIERSPSGYLYNPLLQLRANHPDFQRLMKMFLKMFDRHDSQKKKGPKKQKERRAMHKHHAVIF